MIEALSSANNDTVQQQADILLSDYASTDYALMGQLALAKSHAANGDFESAKAALQQVVGNAAQKPIAYVARTRLAAVQAQAGQYNASLTSLAIEFPSEFAARVEEPRGDIYVLQGKSTEAIEANQKARLAYPQPANGEFLQQKMDDLGGRG